MTNTGTRSPSGVLRPYPTTGDWTYRAACRAVDTEIFYSAHSTATARSICARCPVQFECLDYAIACENLDPYGSHGVWAGLTSSQRNTLRKAQPEINQPDNHLESA